MDRIVVRRTKENPQENESLQLDGTWTPISRAEIDRRIAAGWLVDWSPADENRALEQLKKEYTP